jgi:hypothetical protein
MFEDRMQIPEEAERFRIKLMLDIHKEFVAHARDFDTWYAGMKVINQIGEDKKK